MSNGRGEPGRKGRKHPTDRDGNRFAALPHVVLESDAYLNLSHTARSLLMEVALQLSTGNNGRLLLSGTYLLRRGWRSADVIQRAKQELLENDLIFETVKGHRPNKASWYAVTWRAIDHHPDYDPGAIRGFPRGAYRLVAPKGKAPRAMKPGQQKAKHAVLTPSHGVEGPGIAPSHGVEGCSPTPSHGAIGGVSTPPPTPSHGDHLDMPSIRGRKRRSAGSKGPADAVRACDGCAVGVEG